MYKNICCGFSLEAPHQGTSNEYPQHMFSWKNKKNIDTFGLKNSALSGVSRIQLLRNKKHFSFILFAFAEPFHCKSSYVCTFLHFADLFLQIVCIQMNFQCASCQYLCFCISLFTQSIWTDGASIKYRSRSDATEFSIWSGSTLFAMLRAVFRHKIR